MLVRDDVVEDRPWAAVQREHDPLESLLDRQCGVIARWQALGLITEKALRHKVASGRWRSIHRGVYLAYGGTLTDVQRWWIAALAVSPTTADSTVDGRSAHLAGITALQALGLRGVRSDRIHVLIAHSRRFTMPAGVILHRTTDLPSYDLHIGRPLPITAPWRSVVDAAAWARSDDEARLIIAASFQQRLVSASDIDTVLNRRPAVRRRLLITETARDCAEGSHSVGELGLVGSVPPSTAANADAATSAPRRHRAHSFSRRLLRRLEARRRDRRRTSRRRRPDVGRQRSPERPATRRLRGAALSGVHGPYPTAAGRGGDQGRAHRCRLAPMIGGLGELRPLWGPQISRTSDLACYAARSAVGRAGAAVVALAAAAFTFCA